MIRAITALLLSTAAASAQPTLVRHWWQVSRDATSQLWLDARDHAAALGDRLQASAVRRPTGVTFLQPPASPDATELAWAPLAADQPAPARTVLLIHGLDEPGPIFDDLTPALTAAGYSVARFEYPNDQSIAASADLLTQSLAALFAAGATDVDLVCHSMGGLVARDALTRPPTPSPVAALPRTPRLILLGTPGDGSPWARFEAVAEVREQVMRLATSDDPDWHELLGFLTDGRGQAADDLRPGSQFLTDLNHRPWPKDVLVTAVVGQLLPPAQAADRAETFLARHMSADSARRAAERLRSLAASVGDGVVPDGSAAPPGVDDIVRIQATHRGMLKQSAVEREARSLAGAPRTPPAIPIILDRLARPTPEP